MWFNSGVNSKPPRTSGRGAAFAAALLLALLPGSVGAKQYHLEIGETTVYLSDGPKKAITVNGSLPAPTLRFREGEELVIKVTNNLDRFSSIHWHGMLLPYTQDGAPGFSYEGIAPGETFTYRFDVKQAGTYWYHSHSDFQEQRGVYGAIVIEPKQREPFIYDREYAVVLSDWHDTRPDRIMSNLKRRPDFYNFHRQTLADLFNRPQERKFGDELKDRLNWSRMRMLKTDIADVSGYDFLINGMDSEQNWTALFKPGERVRLRLINASAMSFMDVYIPGMKMTVVQADGNDVRPVTVDEIRLAVGETYDVIVRPDEEKAYTIMAEPMGRTGYARATLAPRKGMSAAVWRTRPRAQLTMADMGHGAAGSMKEHGHEHGHAAMGHKDGRTMEGKTRFYAPGSGLIPTAYNGGRFLSYSDLIAVRPVYEQRPPDRELTVRLTGNMERYIWSINGETFDDAEPVRFKKGERVRLKFVNETMMAHPIHLHGMWMILENGRGRYRPAKHVIQVSPAMTVNAEVEFDAEGHWPLHCHMLYHMRAGMMRRLIVERENPADLPLQ